MRSNPQIPAVAPESVLPLACLCGELAMLPACMYMPATLGPMVQIIVLVGFGLTWFQCKLIPGQQSVRGKNRFDLDSRSKACQEVGTEREEK
jgi:hypothetical protein